MFDDFTMLDTEDIDGSLAAIFCIELDMVVDEDEVSIGTDVLDFSGGIREFLQEAGNAVLEGLLAICKAGAMLRISRTGHFVNDARIMLIENLVPEILNHCLVVLEVRNVRSETRCQRHHTQRQYHQACHDFRGPCRASRSV